jgi:ribonuclease BN (tRNA processing enzyme)
MESYGYRFDTPDRSIVISGDTNPTEETIKACNGCDVLIHEARTEELFAKLPEASHSFGAKNHTTSEPRSIGEQSQARLANCLSRLDFLVATLGQPACCADDW